MYKITKSDILSKLVASVSDANDGAVQLSPSDVTIRIGEVEYDHISSIGVYRISISAADSTGNETAHELDLYVTLSPDTVPPTVTWTPGRVIQSGSAYHAYPYIDEFAYSMSAADVYSWLGIAVTDERTESPTVTYSLMSGSTEIPAATVAGTYTLSLLASDEAGNETQIDFTLHAAVSPDTTAPVIHLRTDRTSWNGLAERWEATLTMDEWPSHTADAAAIFGWLTSGPSTDDRDGTVPTTASLRDPMGVPVPAVNTVTAGAERYQISLTAEDSSGNSDTVTVFLKSVILNDTVAPTITFKPAVSSNTAEMDLAAYGGTITKNQILSALVLSVHDTADGDMPVSSVALTVKDLSNNFYVNDVDSVGNFLLKFTATDSSSNSSEYTVLLETVQSPDTTAPVIVYSNLVNDLTMTASMNSTTYPYVTITTSEIISQLVLSVTDDRDPGPFSVACRIYDTNEVQQPEITYVGQWRLEFEVSDVDSNTRTDSVALTVSYAADVEEPQIWWNLSVVDYGSIDQNTKTATASMQLIDYVGGIINEGVCQDAMVDLVEDNYLASMPKSSVQFVFVTQGNTQIPFITDPGTYTIKASVTDGSENTALWNIETTVI